MPGLVLASALFLTAGSPAFAQPATVYPESGGLVPFHGLRDSGVTITANINASQTSVPISDPARLKVGQIVETEDANREIMEITGLGTSTMQVNRGAMGTAPASHTLRPPPDLPWPLYSDFTAIKVMASAVGNRTTGATLSTALDAGTLETAPSGAFLAQSTGTSETTINVTDATLLGDATVLRIDGTAYVSVTNTNFLGSTGRNVMCPWNSPGGDNIMFGCTTLGATPLGPNGSGILAEVRLRAEREGAVSLHLQDVLLIHADVDATPITVEEVLDGSATVVSGSPSPPPTPAPDCGGTGTKVCILPSSQNVGLGNEFTAYVVAQNVTNLGSYQFKLKWTPATEQMSVLSVHRGYLDDSGGGWYRNANLWADINETVTNVPLGGIGQLQAGYTARVGGESEEMLILAVSAGPPASMTVIRGYHGTTAATHSVGASVYAGPERITVTRATLPAPHSVGMDFRVNLRLLRVSNQSLLSASALQIDSEQFKVMELPARTLQSTGLTLASGVDAAVTTLPVNGSGSVQKGWVLQVENELMPVTGVGSGTVQVARGFFGTQASSHGAGTSIKAVFLETNTVRTSRGFGGTSIASHAAGASIIDVDGLGSYGFTTSSSGAPAVIDFVWAANDSFLGGTGRTVQCNPPTLGGSNISFQCSTTGTLPLGPTGAGTLATVNVTGKALLANTPSQPLSLSAVILSDISGDTLAVTTALGSVRVVGCPDIDNPAEGIHKDGVVDFGKDTLDVARAALVPGHTKVPGHDVDRNGIVDFGGDTLMTAKLALLINPRPLRCPLNQ
jgi:hypothetical protein